MLSDNKKICRKFDREIWLYFDGALPDEQIQIWQSHLQNCASCRQNLREIEAVQQPWKAITPVDVHYATFAGHIARPTLKNRLPQNYRPPVPPLFKKLGAILLPLAAAIVLYLRLNSNEMDYKYNWEPQNYQQTVAAIDSAIADLQSDPLWAEANLSPWDQGSADLEYSIESLSNTLDDNN